MRLPNPNTPHKMKTATEPNQYDAKATLFLVTTGVSLDIRRADPCGAGYAPQWSEGREHGNQYKVTLSRPGKSVSFDFWGSINDRKNGKDPSAYSVLACISGDVNCPETFEDFCAECGYDEDSRKAFAKFERCAEFARELRAFFSDEEQAALSEII